MKVRLRAALLVMVLCGMPVSAQTADQAEVYRRVTALLAQVPHTPELEGTVHTNPQVLGAIGLFLEASDHEQLNGEQLVCERFLPLVPNPPWDWVPTLAIHKVRSKLSLVAIGQAWVAGASTLYLFDGARHVKIDSGEVGTVQVDSFY